MRVIIIATLSADGYIARDTREPVDWSSSESRRYITRITKELGTIITGARTFETVGRPLLSRRVIVYSRQPERYADLDVDVTNEAPRELIARLKAEGTTSLVVRGGIKTYEIFLKAGVVDELYLAVEPVLLGRGIRLLTDKVERRLSLVDLQKLGRGSYVAHYRFPKNRRTRES